MNSIRSIFLVAGLLIPAGLASAEGSREHEVARYEIVVADQAGYLDSLAGPWVERLLTGMDTHPTIILWRGAPPVPMPDVFGRFASADWERFVGNAPRNNLRNALVLLGQPEQVTRTPMGFCALWPHVLTDSLGAPLDLAVVINADGRRATWEARPTRASVPAPQAPIPTVPRPGSMERM